MTPKQREALEAYRKYGSIRAAARALNEAYSGVQAKVQRALRYERQDPAIQSVMSEVGTDLIPSTVWLKTNDHSVMLRPPKAEESLDSTIDALREGLADLKAKPRPVAPPALKNLAAIFPIADLHLGLLTDEEEVGEDWDTKIASEVFQTQFGRLVEVTPASQVAVIAQLGDLTHSDDQRNVTPQSGHQLDVDSRYFVILRKAVATMKWAIEELRSKYPKVIYRGCRGNHDMTAHYAVTLALAQFYEDVDDVEIVQDANEFYVFEWGKTMLLLHHGDKAKPDRLVHFAAAQWPKIWGRTRYRLALSGHVHHDTRKEIGGMCFESIGTIIPRDAHAYQNAYGSNRSLISIALDLEDGEISRNRVNVH